MLELIKVKYHQDIKKQLEKRFESKRGKNY